ncbi:MAG: hypothetical protein HOC05_17180 [Gemmatimonadetes bacterium]|jgi:hypothetical protein|nr:hypothetical protein [Gemmatimonadota bacterium]MBT5141073.1 hypothetical protein [Gemmatimonadota bacterium]MBT5592060.1 hypothetical protein [Gemmatimonadota bacterium]MBT5964642.1 hypothetical protein [Gemmatimonadota bacterium]MBT6630898.1 hypothetical protein [Gemmatimonadota bacterium]
MLDQVLEFLEGHPKFSASIKLSNAHHMPHRFGEGMMTIIDVRDIECFLEDPDIESFGSMGLLQV